MSPASSDQALHLTRIFQAPRELVFEAWTNPQHFKNWFGPRDSSIVVREMDARPDGILHFCHRLPGGREIWVKSRYVEVSRPGRLVFTSRFSDAAGNLVERPGFFLETRIEVTFQEKGNRTEVTIHQTGLTADQGESEGWKQGFERLDGVLSQLLKEG